MMSVPHSKCLSFHADYRCRHSGVCCQSGWDIPFDPGEVTAVRALQLGGGALLEPIGDRPALAVREANGSCSFFDPDTHLCAIHAAGGHDALPLTCRMFPRVVLHDPRGTFISLSHFCPTAASLLFEDTGPVTIVDAPDALAQDGALDGLDAQEAWPPLLRDGVLTDLDSYGRWEGLSIALLTRSGLGARRSLSALADATAVVAAWTPGGETLINRVERAFANIIVSPHGAIAGHDSAVQRWLAARLFATWIAYQGRGLETIVRYLGMCLNAFERELAQCGDAMEAIRRSDYHLIHESSSQRLALLCDQPSPRRRNRPSEQPTH
jgi:Fe-S-cluster containining protein